MVKFRYLIATVFSVILGCVSVSATNGQERASLPENWSKMEIEAKWEINAEKYDELVRAFADDSEWSGFKMNVRWGGVSRKFIDIYYDTGSSSLSRNLHSLRHRTRYRSVPQAANNDEESLDVANWQEDWQRVQYKSTPCNIGATWFRIEAGNCRTKDAGGDRLCVGSRPLTVLSVLGGELPSHAGISLLARDHSDILLTELQPILHVFDYRYRVLFEKDGRAVYEMSLDRVTSTDLIAGGTVRTFEAELEIVSSDRTKKQVEDLIRIADQIQNDFELTPSTRSKAGLPVSACT